MNQDGFMKNEREEEKTKVKYYGVKVNSLNPMIGKRKPDKNLPSFHFEDIILNANSK